MTLNVLRTATRLNLRSIRKETEAAVNEGIITPAWATAILAAHSSLAATISGAVEDCKGMDEVERVRGSGSTAERRGGSLSAAPAASQPSGSLDSETLVLHEGGKGDAA